MLEVNKIGDKKTKPYLFWAFFLEICKRDFKKTGEVY
jgi:hypothetical protein